MRDEDVNNLKMKKLEYHDCLNKSESYKPNVAIN